MLADIILRIASEDGKEEGHVYKPRPSSAGPEKCIRQMVYYGLKTPHKPLPGRAIMIFSDSSFHEDLTGDWLRRSAFHLHSEQMKIDAGERYGIHLEGSIDGIVTDVLGVDRHYEHKGISHFAFQKYWAGELPLDNISQTCIYNYGLKKLNPDIKESVILFKNKNTAAYLEFLIRFENDIALIVNRINSQGETIKMGIEIRNVVDDAFKKFAKVQDYIERRTLPKRQYDMDHWRCSYCSYTQTCYENYEKEFNELKTDTELPDEIADTVRYRQETAAHILEMKKENDVISKKLKEILKDAGAREGRAGEYLCKLKLMETNKIDKALLTDAEREKATKKGFQERLYISKIKEKSNG